MFSFFKKKPSEKEYVTVGNRCYGCEHHKSRDDVLKEGRTYTKCDVNGFTLATIGCNNFIPHEIASCDRCFYLDGIGGDGYICKKLNRRFKKAVDRCQHFADKQRELREK